MTRARQRGKIRRMTTETVRPRVPDLTLGWRLRMALKAGKVSSQAMADYLGVERSTISRWMNDHGAPPRSAYQRQWAMRCGVDVDWLMDGKAPEDPRHGPTGGGAAPGPDDGFPRLDDEGRPSVTKLLSWPNAA